MFEVDYLVEDNYNKVFNLLEVLEQDLASKVENEFISIEASLKKIELNANEDVSDWLPTEQEIDKDIQYIENQIQILNNKQYQAILSETKNLNLEIQNYTKVLTALNDGHTIYKHNIDSYEKNIAKKLQIPFYNISSKILQTRFEGGKPASGVILEAPDDSRKNAYYRFCSSTNAEHDAWNTMSSGQLAGVIIAFMLAMNKVFPTGMKTLLIDDPIQTMDDINMASFIQLLREEFSDYQIILSTHESRIANYIMYKYQVSGLKPKAINLKNEKKTLAIMDS